jgi:hypothetical protein
MRIQEAQKHMDPADPEQDADSEPDADPEHCLLLLANNWYGAYC